MRMDERLTHFVVAMCTYAMGRLASCHARIQRSGVGSTSVIGQIIPLVVCSVCFEANKLFFRLAFFVQQRLLRRLGRECAAMGGSDLSGLFEGLESAGSILQSKRRVL